MLTSLDFINKGQVFPPKSEEERRNDYETNKLLYEGDHHKVFKDVIKKIRERNAKNAETAVIVLNYFKRLTTVWLDLMLGEPPKFKAPTPEQQKWLDEFILMNNLVQVNQEVAIDESRFGVGLYKNRYDGRSIIESANPLNWYPVYDKHNNKKTIAHVFASESEEVIDGWLGSKKQNVVTFEIEEFKSPFIIIKRFEYSKDGDKSGSLGDLIEEIRVPKGMSDFFVSESHNLKTSDKNHGTNDYKDVATIVREIMLRFCQISAILDKHSDPSIIAPYSMLEKDPQTGLSIAKKKDIIVVDSEEKLKPEYLVWNAQLEFNFQQIEKLLEQLYVVSETSPSLFGDNKSGKVESGSAMKKLLISPIAKVARLRNSMDIALKRAIFIASSLDNCGFIPQIEWQDGIPGDPLEDAQIEQIRLGGQKNSSVVSSIMRLNGCSREEAEVEYEQIKEEDSVMTPDMNVNPIDSTDDSSQNAK